MRKLFCKRFINLLVIALLILPIFSSLAIRAHAEDTVSVKLLSVNDLHGKIDLTGIVNNVKYGRADYLATYLKARKATNPDNTLIIHSGDMIGGSSPVSALLRDEPTVEIMEAIGFDVGTVGNHEFDKGTQEFLRMVNGGDSQTAQKDITG